MRERRLASPHSRLLLEIWLAVANMPFLALTVLWAGMIGFEIHSEITSAEIGTSTYPTTALIEAVIRAPLKIIGTVLLIWYSAEIVWRERTLRMSEIIQATPAPNTLFVVSKCVALATLAGVFTIVAFLVGALIQIARGYPIEPALLLSFAYVNFIPLALFAIVAVLIQVLSQHKYLGMFLVLFFAVINQRLFGIEHPLLRFAQSPGITWSAFNGFGPFSAPFHWLMLYWSAFAGLCLLLAIAKWRREPQRSQRGFATGLSLVLVASGAFIFFNTPNETSRDLLDWKADYERKYETWAALPLPRIREVRANVDLDPAQRRYRVRGEYLLVNETSRPIDRLLVAVRRDAATASVALENARLRTHDKRFNQYVLDVKLVPGERTTLRFDITYETRGFRNDNAIVENGSWIMSFRAFPTIGYRASYEIEDARERRRRGLRGTARRSEEAAEIATGDWTRFDVTVSTAADQIVVAPGTLVRDWTSDGRRFFHFKSSQPIPNQFAIASARYRVARETHGGVAIEVYYHPEHGRNVARIMRAAADSLQLFSEQFGPYPHRHLRVAEVPLYWGFGGFAQPGVVFLQETRGFQIDERDAERLDLTWRRVAHEVAHQWWGHNLVAADAPGATMLIETLTKYSELMALDGKYGSDQVRRSLQYEHDLYLSQRTSERDEEPPLARAGDHAYVYYRKGSIVMQALKDLLGEPALNAALRNLVREHGGASGKATAADLLRHLHAVAPPEHHALIDEWMNAVVLYDLELESADSRRLADGRYEVRMRIRAAKSNAKPIREAITVGLFAGETQLHRDRYALRDGQNDIAVIVDKAPDRAVLDPDITRIDRNRFDNAKDVD